MLFLVAKLCLFCDPIDCSPPGFSVHGISRWEYWSELPFSSPGDLPHPGISYIGRQIRYHWATREAPQLYTHTFFHCRIFSISDPLLLNANSSWVIGSVKEPLLQIFKHEWVAQGLGAFCLRLWTLEEQKRKNIRSWRKEAEWRIRGTEHLVFRISYTKLWMLYLNKEFSKIILTIRQTSR